MKSHKDVGFITFSTGTKKLNSKGYTFTDAKIEETKACVSLLEMRGCNSGRGKFDALLSRFSFRKSNGFQL